MTECSNQSKPPLTTMVDRDCIKICTSEDANQSTQDLLSDSFDSIQQRFTGFSKMSEMLFERNRGPAKKQRKLLHAERSAEIGKAPFEDKEELKVQQAEVAFPDLRGSAAASIQHDVIMEQKQNEPSTDDN